MHSSSCARICSRSPGSNSAGPIDARPPPLFETASVSSAPPSDRRFTRVWRAGTVVTAGLVAVEQCSQPDEHRNRGPRHHGSSAPWSGVPMRAEVFRGNTGTRDVFPLGVTHGDKHRGEPATTPDTYAAGGGSRDTGRSSVFLRRRGFQTDIRRRGVGGASSAYRNAYPTCKPNRDGHRFDSAPRWSPTDLATPIRDTPQGAWVFHP